MPFTIAIWERANTTPSDAVGSYECGSVFGFTMMLCTATLLPPNWLAMLPQKFSAATTCSFPDDEPPAGPALPPPHALSRTAQQTSSGTTRNGTRSTTVPPAISGLVERATGLAETQRYHRNKIQSCSQQPEARNLRRSPLMLCMREEPASATPSCDALLSARGRTRRFARATVQG